MVKLSQQTTTTQTLQRPTRTARVLQKQEQQKAVAERQRLETLQEQADEIREEEFSEVSSISEYETKYNQLSPQIKQFFASPQQLRQDKVERIETTTEKVEARISYAKERKEASYQNYLKDLEYSRNKRWRSDEARQKYEQRTANKWDSNEAYWTSYANGLREGLGNLRKNQDISFGDVDSYASEKGSLSRDKVKSRQQGRDSQQTAYRKLLKTPFGKVYQEYEEKNKGKIDWENPENVKKIQRAKWVDTYANVITNVLAKGKTKDLTAQRYKAIVGEKQFDATSSTLKEQYDLEYKKQLDNARKEAFSNWQKEDAKKPRLYDVSGVEPFAGTKPPTFFQFLKDYSPAVRGTLGFSKKVYDKIPSGTLYYTPPVTPQGLVIHSTVGGISPFKILPYSTTLKEQGKEEVASISNVQQDLFLGEITGSGLKEKTDKEFQAQYQTAFERKYMKDLIYEKVEFEDAKKEFAESDDAKKIQQRYNLAIETGRAGKFTKQGFGIAGLSVLKTGIQLRPTTVKGAVVTTGGVVSGIKVLGLIPPLAMTTATTGLGVYGTAVALSPTSSPEKKAGGVITATLSFSSLGLQGIKYARQPTTKLVKTDAPRGYKTNVVGINEKKIARVMTGGKTYDITKTTYPAQKLSAKVGVAGRRTVVSTKFRDFLHLDPIYKGVPTAQQGKTYVLSGFRTSTTYTTPSGYQKALKLLTKRGGLTTSQAQRTLRYYSPKAYDITLEKGQLFVMGKKATGTFTYRIDQPVVEVNKYLGIKTRGAKSVREIYKVNRELLGKVRIRQGRGFSERGIVVDDVTKTSMFIGKDGAYNTLGQAGKTKTYSKIRSLVEVGKTQESYSKLAVRDIYGQVSEKFPYKFSDLTGTFQRRQILPTRQNRYTYGKSEAQITTPSEEKEIIRLDFDKYQGVSYDTGFIKTNIKKTSLSKTFKELPKGDLKKVEKVLRMKKIIGVDKAFPKGSPKNLDAIDDFSSRFTGSTYQGTGVYERTESVGSGGLSTKLMIKPEHIPIQSERLLQGATLPTPKTFTAPPKLKDLIKVKLMTGTGFASTSIVGGSLLNQSKLNTKLTPTLKSFLKIKLDTGVKDDIKPKSDVKSAVDVKLSTGLEQSPKLDTALIQTPVTSPDITFDTPTVDITTPTIPTGFFGLFPLDKVEKKLKGKKSKKIKRLAYLPDFTSRVLGLPPEILTERQAQKRVKKILTGAGIRRSVRVKF